jgi:hypothetical protein
MIPAAGYAGWVAGPVGSAASAGAGVGRGALVTVCDGRRCERKVAE